MSEEEKQAVKNFENLLKKHFEETSVTSGNFLDGVKGIHILNIIENQQKEIERLKKFEKYYENGKVVWQRKDYISKEKIEEKIEEINNEKLNYSEDEYYLENEIKGYAIDKLKELLGE